MALKADAKILALSLALLAAIGAAGAPRAEEEEIILGGKRIVGGEPTTIKEHPWQVALAIKRGGGTLLCGGSIIARKWVLSAAHCFRPSDPPDLLRAKAGATEINQGVWSPIERVVIHEKYDSTTHENDLALVKLKTPPAAGRVIPLVEASATIPPSEPLEVTGWGATAEGARGSRGLLRATVPYVDNATCNEPASYDGKILRSMMCAGRREGGVDSCQGPLVWKTSAGPVLVGVVSYGEGCARNLKYGIYTRVSAYRDWINGVVTADRN